MKIPVTVDVRPGWLTAAAGLVVASLAGYLVVAGAISAPWIAGRAAVAAVTVLALAAVLGSEGLAGAAGIPLLLAAVIDSDVDGGPTWGRAMIVGCLWYGAVELVWTSIEGRRGAVVAPAVAHRRIREISTVIIIALGIGLIAAAVASLAPTRTVLAQAAGLGIVLLTVLAATRQLGPAPPARAEAPERGADREGVATPDLRR